MTKIEPALDRLHTALEKLGTGVHQSRRSEVAERTKSVDLDTQCAHLRAEVSALKKQNQDLDARCRRAAQQIDKVTGQINDVLEGE
ncbi:MAG: hypothetical protein ISQ27_02640 [PS1 clade bacterium]|nr:hypothetical protein [PS1 clade bacterium]CAI8334532.1 MAG: Uncharacterised protein [Rhodobiaceae bacterium UBA7378]HCQ82319.1 hypothetical protein [Rhodobiaceae bacterium]|tara:strand:- start:60 stop:317 length:258 start_codon:yes stop_codon:yes gene_type:complete